MKNKLWLTLLFPLALLIGSSKDVQEPKLPNGEDLVGTWELVKMKTEDATSYTDIPKFVIYRKMITKKHFTWISYDADGNEVNGMGGGTYTLKNGTYIENIEYFFPQSGLIGDAIPFDCKIVDGEWHHKGYIQHREYDAEKDRQVVVRTERIEEVWRRID